MELLGLIRNHALVSLLAASLALPASSPPTSRPLLVVGFSDDRVEMVERAVELYREAGLELPPLVVRRSDSDEVCRGRIAFHRSEGAGSEIVLCYPSVARREWRILLHELGHAWASVGLTDAHRAAFQDVRGFEYWRDYQRADWRDNGTEQAAEVLKWALSDVPVPVFIADDSCEQLHDGYVALTGSEPPHGLADLCRGDVAADAGASNRAGHQPPGAPATPPDRW